MILTSWQSGLGSAGSLKTLVFPSVKWDKNVLSTDFRTDRRVGVVLSTLYEYGGAVPQGRWLPMTAGPRCCLPGLDNVLAAWTGYMGTVVFPEIRMLNSNTP